MKSFGICPARKSYFCLPSVHNFQILNHPYNSNILYKITTCVPLQHYIYIDFIKTYFTANTYLYFQVVIRNRRAIPVGRIVLQADKNHEYNDGSDSYHLRAIFNQTWGEADDIHVDTGAYIQKKWLEETDAGSGIKYGGEVRFVIPIDG